VQGRLGEAYIKQSLDMRSWEGAQEPVREWEAKGTMQADVKRVTVSEAAEKFLKELRTRHVTQTVIRKFEILLQERLKVFCDAKGCSTLTDSTSRPCGISDRHGQSPRDHPARSVGLLVL
jgi:hypothetical protein